VNLSEIVKKKCFAPTYNCSTQNKTCYQVPPGFGTSLDVCKETCGKTLKPSKQSPSAPVKQDLYKCDEQDLTCKKSQQGLLLPACQTLCGTPSNVTPVQLIGDYRGLQINRGYVKGEWTMQITAAVTVIKDPSNNVWAQGRTATYGGGELWLITNKGNYRGIDSPNTLPEVLTLTWALGPLGGSAPSSIDDAMKSGTVFTMKKCRNANNCKWILSNLNNKNKEIKSHDKYYKHEVSREQRINAINDPCQAYTECGACVQALDYCGWCSQNVLYSGPNALCEISGKNCVGLNKTKIGATFCCDGTFSTLPATCPQPPSGTPPTSPPTTIPPLRPTSPVKPPPPTQPVVLYVCNPNTSICEKK